MLFQTQKRLLTERIEQALPALANTPDPATPARYTAFQSDGKTLIQTNVGNEIAVKQVIDNAGDDLKVEGSWTYAVVGEVLAEILSKSNILDKISATFEPSATAETIKSLTPDKAPVNLLGNFVLNFPGDETWGVPVVDLKSVNIPTNPQIDLSGHKLTVSASELSRFVNQVGMAVGKDGGNSSYRNVSIRSKGKDSTYEIVAATPIHLARACAKSKSSSAEFSMTIPYQHVLTAMKILDQTQDVDIIYNSGSPGTAVFRQDIIYGDRNIGTIYIKLTCSTDPFAKFEKLIDSLNYSNIIKLKTQQFRPICSKLEIPRPPKTEMHIDAAKKKVTFSKKEAGRVKAGGVSIDVEVLKGENFDVNITSRILAESVANAELEELVWEFSGRTSLSHMRIVHRDDGATLDTYFPPFSENE